MPKTVTLKWNKNQYVIDLDEISDVDALRGKISTLTNVPVDRQKLTYKAKMIKNDFDISTIVDNGQIMLIGTAGPVVTLDQAPKVIFAEDLGESDRRKLIPSIPAGLANLGNTCYANSIIQMLMAAPEFVSNLELTTKFAQSTLGINPQLHLSKTLALLFSRLETSNADEPVVPSEFISTLRRAYPRFNETTEFGIHAQQDADECLATIMDAVASATKNSHIPKSDSSVVLVDRSISGGKDNIVDTLFGFSTGITTELSQTEIDAENTKMTSEYEAKTKQLENEAKLNDSVEDNIPTTSSCPPMLLKKGDEPVSIQVEDSRRLTVSINASTNYMVEGLKDSMTEEVQKRSDSLKRSASYERSHKMLELPRYLLVRFNRFSWRQDIRKKAKVVRKVIYPLEYDAFELVGGPLREILTQKRREASEKKDAEIAKASGGKTIMAKSTAATMDDTPSSADALTSIDIPSLSKDNITSSGRYSLVSLVTHKGRGADMGHYIGWRKVKGVWYKFNDDVVTEVREDEIERLCGGGDLDTAYIIMYARIDDLAKE